MAPYRRVPSFDAMEAKLTHGSWTPGGLPAGIKKTPSESAGGLTMHLSIPIRDVEGSTMSILVPPAGFEGL